ncbi:hypothetical protein L7F22_011200 [Adiantum nelumboides]|nr:hypothetical protein [Adiantum nelumboides]
MWKVRKKIERFFLLQKQICNLLRFGSPVDVQEMPAFGFIGIRRCGVERSWYSIERKTIFTMVEDACLLVAVGKVAHHKKVKEKGKSSSATINQPKDAHSPSTAKGRPPRTAKGRPSTSKKRPRPAVSESSESLEEQFELLSNEDAEDSKHADSEQQSDSPRSSPSGRSRSQGSRRSSPSRQLRSQGSRRSIPARGSSSRDSQARTSDTARSHTSGADLDDSKATLIKPLHLAGPSIYSQVVGVTFVYRQMDPNARLGGVRLMWTDLPTHCKVDAGFGGVPLWNVFTDGIVQSVFTIAAEFLLDDGALVVACRAKHLFKVISEAYDFQFCHIRTLFLCIPMSWTAILLIRWIIGTFTTVADVVLDCLAGCGGMAIECEQLHQRCINIEKDVVVFRSLLFPQQRLSREVGTVLHYGDFSRSEELERATSLQPPVQPPIPHFYPPPTPQPPGIAQWLYGPSYPPPYTFMRPHSAWPPVMGGRPPLQRPLFSPPPMEPPLPPGQYPPSPLPQP